jgi:hypothetical protein
METIRAIKNKGELEGTCYVELLPGKYKEQCWNASSLFFEEEVFGYLENIISKHVPAYDHYAFTQIDKVAWDKIIDDFQSLESTLDQYQSVEDLRKDVGFLFRGSEVQFAENFKENKAALGRLLSEVSIWISKESSQKGCVTVLGL